MILFTKPTALNGTQLREELRTAGVTISNDINAILDTSNGSLELDIKKADESKAAAVVAAHVGVDLVTKLTLQEKLLTLGISLDEIKDALQ